MVLILLENDSGNRTALSFAAENGNLDIFKLLVKKKAELNTGYDEKHGFILHVAIAYGRYEIAEFLIKNRVMNVNRVRKGFAPLHLAVALGHQNIVECLIRNGAYINVKNQDRLIPLHAAVGLQVGLNEEVLKDFSLENINHCMNENMNCYVNIVRFLLENRADVNAVVGENLDTPLIWAAKKGYVEIAKVLIAYGANVYDHDEDGKTPLMLALTNGHLETAKFLQKSVYMQLYPMMKTKSAELMFKKSEENKTKFACHYCLKTVQGSYMLNCGHLPFCEHCSKTILEQKDPKCPVCNKNVRERNKVFLDTVTFSTSNTEEAITPITIE